LAKKGDVYKSKKEYIIHVINYGSHQFNFKGGVMEGGYIPKEDANKVACYVMSLSGESCSYDDEAKAIFSSSCAGCHGVDGKGLNGLYPDLSKKRLLGLKASDD
jgi:cytochrome c oxidase cbb3-type subunit 3